MINHSTYRFKRDQNPFIIHLVYPGRLDQYDPSPQAAASSALPDPTPSLAASWPLNLLFNPPCQPHLIDHAPGSVRGLETACSHNDDLGRRGRVVDSAGDLDLLILNCSFVKLIVQKIII